MIRVLVVAESAIVRAGLDAMLHEEGGYETIQGGFSSAAFERVNGPSTGGYPDVILAEIPRKNVASFRLSAKNSPPIVLLLDDVSRNDLLKALGAGVRAVLPRNAQPAEIFAAIEAAAAGLTALDPEQLELLLPAANGIVSELEPGLVEGLSQREVEVLELMSQGLANKNIADRLGISEHTVKFHVSSILSKLGATSRTEAVTKGLKNRLLMI